MHTRTRAHTHTRTRAHAHLDLSEPASRPANYNSARIPPRVLFISWPAAHSPQPVPPRPECPKCDLISCDFPRQNCNFFGDLFYCELVYLHYNECLKLAEQNSTFQTTCMFNKQTHVRTRVYTHERAHTRTYTRAQLRKTCSCTHTCMNTCTHAQHIFVAHVQLCKQHKVSHTPSGNPPANRHRQCAHFERNRAG